VPRRRSGKAKLVGQARGVILIGFMGAGKTCVGQALSAELAWNFEDLDDHIEQVAGRKIAEIFRDSGEVEFRRIEHEALRTLLEHSGLHSRKVIALGGGAFVQEMNAALIEAAKLPTAFLDAGVEELWDRCKRQLLRDRAQRPLMASREQFRKLYEERRPHYLKASLRVETSGKSVEQIVRKIIQGLDLRPKRSRSEGETR
jgi:shikimate kinase